MTEVSRRAFAEFTARNVGQKAEYRLDGRTVTAPVIREPITGGAGQISNSAYDVEQMRRIAERLASGQATLEVGIVSP